jgi:hypothetical protein
MSWLKKLFGKTESKKETAQWIKEPAEPQKTSPQATSLGAPLEFKCARCGDMLHGGTGHTVSGGMEVLDHIRKRAKRCPSCGKIFCGKCSIEVDQELGRPPGAVDFTCPFCRTTGISG